MSVGRVESVQRKLTATKRLPGYRDLVMLWQKKAVMCYKIVFGLVKLKFSEFFVVARLHLSQYSKTSL